MNLIRAPVISYLYWLDSTSVFIWFFRLGVELSCCISNAFLDLYVLSDLFLRCLI